jgi:threonine/homoserine/homoserine lactone efflux protein
MLALAVIGGWVAGQADPVGRMAWVLPVMMLFALTSNLTYALVGSLLRHWLAGPDGSGQRLLTFNRLMAAVLVITAVWMLRP